MNPHERKAHKILSLARLPIPPLAQIKLSCIDSNLITPIRILMILAHCALESKYGKIALSMNPQNPFQPINSTPPPPKLPQAADEQTRKAAANVARSQLNQIFGTDGQPNATLSHSNSSNASIGSQTMIERRAPATVVPPRSQIASSNLNSTASPSVSQQNLSTANPANTQAATNPYDQTHAPTSNTDIETVNRNYHSAWQNYYQKYYEKYYIDALQEQKGKFIAGQASVEDTTQDDGTLTQKEAVDELRSDLLGKVKDSAKKMRKSRHFIPAIAAVFVILVMVFIQYNGLIFAQVSSFVSPSTTADQDIIIGTGSDQVISSEPKVIIPKINVSAPVIYNLTDLSETSSQTALQSGTIHYPIAGASAYPGQNGNTVVLGHSSADFFEPGNYKFIFVQLNRLAEGDLFYLDFNGKRYTYKVFKSEIISPNEVGKLAIGDDKPYATLVTCDPPGTANYRLVVYGEQISPDPSGATETQNSSGASNTNIVGNPPTVFEQIFGR